MIFLEFAKKGTYTLATVTESERSQEIIRICKDAYGSIAPFLAYNTPFQLLVAVAMSAQTTDEQVNRCTPTLFEKYPTERELALASLEDIESIIKTTGFFRSKARHIKGAAMFLIENFAGCVPDNMEDLIKIPGIGRKSAGVILHYIFGKPAIIVDTHFGRVSRKLGFTSSEDPFVIEKDIAALVPLEFWSDASMLLNVHGRRICQARKPRCAECRLISFCPSAIVGSSLV